MQNRAPVAAFWQQFCPVPPHAFGGVPHELAVQAPKAPPQLVPVAMHVPLLQQLPAAAQVAFWQQVMLVPPQATLAELLQIEPVILGMFCPDATHEPPTQQPPPPQVFPGQHAWPAPPQTGQVPAVQAAPVEQVDPVAIQLLLPGSQQPPLPQVLPAQQGWPGPPHARHRPLPHAVAESLQVLPAQQG